MIHQSDRIGISNSLGATYVLCLSLAIRCVNRLILILRICMLNREEILTLRTCLRIIRQYFTFDYNTQIQGFVDHKLLILQTREIQIFELHCLDTTYTVVRFVRCFPVSRGKALGHNNFDSILKEWGCISILVQLHDTPNQSVLSRNLQITEVNCIHKSLSLICRNHLHARILTHDHSCNRAKGRLRYIVEVAIFIVLDADIECILRDLHFLSRIHLIILICLTSLFSHGILAKRKCCSSILRRKHAIIALAKPYRTCCSIIIGNLIIVILIHIFLSLRGSNTFGISVNIVNLSGLLILHFKLHAFHRLTRGKVNLMQ